MTIGLGLTIDWLGEDTRKLVEQLDGITVTTLGDAHRVVTRDITLKSTDNLVKLLSGYVKLQSFNFGLHGDHKWTKPNALVVAAEITGDEFVFLDEGNVFEPSLPNPCLGLVAPQTPIRIVEKPIGHACCAKNDTIFSEQMSNLLLECGDASLGPVVCKERRVDGWYRLFAKNRRPIIAKEGLETGECRICHVPGVWTPGVTLGRAPVDCDFCQNADGLTHGNIAHPFIVSTKAAKELATRLRAGFGMFPIIDSNSLEGRKVVELLAQFKSLSKP
jgi:hypothetical protein